MALYLEFDKIVRRFTKAKLRYAVAGGLAVGLHGHIRATQDMDFVIHQEDFEKTSQLLLKLGFRANPLVQEFKRAGLQLKRFFQRSMTDDELIIVDLLIPASAAMSKILSRAITIPYRKGSIRVITAPDLVKMKKLRGSIIDQADIEFLEKSNEK